MNNTEFYNIIDGEIDALIDKYQNDDFLQKQATDQRKAYGFLIWFLEFYAGIFEYPPYITEGRDDNSCDIVFDKKINGSDKRIFYIVQSKWNTISKVESKPGRGDIVQALNEFETILRGDKNESVNDKLKVRLQALKEHIQNNGEVKFIFLALCQKSESAKENIESFIKNQGGQTSFEFIDINRIKNDYIDRKYKGIKPINPFEKQYNLKETKIILEIERLKQQGNHIQVDRPFEAYIFLIRPKTIFELFEKYGFALFFENIRNPLLQSNFNQDIEQTAKENPAFFWYYNNGITAITYILPEIRNQATKIEVTGFQIINGAQTVYSLYKVYKEASPLGREQMDNQGLITLRLMQSGGKNFDLNVTRFTNSQNPVNDRDFYANDSIQERLQQESYQTDVWYERRKGEFREIPNGIGVVSNEVLAPLYMAYILQDISSMFLYNVYLKETRKNLNFISKNDRKDGQYEMIFNERTTFEDMLCAFYLGRTIHKSNIESNNRFYFKLCLFKTLVTKYLSQKYSPDINVNKQIIKLYKEGNTNILIKAFAFIDDFVKNHPEHYLERNGSISFTPKGMLEELEKVTITVEDIESIQV